MKIATFKKGIHPPDSKYTAAQQSRYFFPPKGATMVYPMQQHLGAPCEPIVKIGQKVDVGEKLGDSDKYVSSPVFAAVSGTVTDIREVLTSTGRFSNAVIIENDGEYRDLSSINKPVDFKSISKDEILRHVRETGIVGLGGAGFPTHVKLNPPPDKPIDTVIINAAECEPYLTNDHRVLLEESEKVFLGLEVLLHLFPEARGIIAIENNKQDAIDKLTEMCKNPRVTVKPMQTKYPQGAEKQIIVALLGREVPSGGLPMDVGCIVQNIDTIIALHRAFYRGRPLMRKIVTVAGGAVKKPGNYKVRLGMLYKDMIEAIGGLNSTPYKIVMGGPMMGIAHYNLNIPVIKTSSAVLLFTEEECKSEEERDCFRCGKCVDHCPMGLVPLDLDQFARHRHHDKFEKFSGIDCMECSCCSYSCPAKRHLAQSISFARRELMARRSS